MTSPEDSTTPPPPSPRNLLGVPGGVWGLSAVILVNRAGTMVMPFLALYLTQELGLAKGSAGFIIASYGAGAMIGVTLGGYLTDRLGAATVMLASLFLSAATLVVLGNLESAGEIQACLFVFAIVGDMFRPANAAAIAMACPRQYQSRAFAVQRLAVNVGMTIGPAIGGYLAEVDYGLLFHVNSATCLVTAVVLLFALPLLPNRGREPQPRETSARHSPWRDPPFLAVMVVVAVNAIVFFQVFTTLSVYWNEVCGFDEHVIGWLYAVNTGLIIAFEMLLVVWLERFEKLHVAAVGVVFLGAGLFIMPLGSSVSFIIFTICIWTIGEMLTAPFTASYTASRAPAGSTGRYMAVFGLAFSVAHMVGPAGGLWVYGRFGADCVWYVSGAICAVVTPVLWTLARR